MEKTMIARVAPKAVKTALFFQPRLALTPTTRPMPSNQRALPTQLMLQHATFSNHIITMGGTLTRQNLEGLAGTLWLSFPAISGFFQQQETNRDDTGLTSTGNHFADDNGYEGKIRPPSPK